MLCSVFEVQTDGLQANRYRMIQVQMDCKSPLFVKRHIYEQNLCRKHSKSLVFYKLEFSVTAGNICWMSNVTARCQSLTTVLYRYPHLQMALSFSSRCKARIWNLFFHNMNPFRRCFPPSSDFTLSPLTDNMFSGETWSDAFDKGFVGKSIKLKLDPLVALRTKLTDTAKCEEDTFWSIKLIMGCNSLVKV